MSKEYFVEGLGYMEFIKGEGWYLRRTPDGKPGASFKAELIGADADEVSIRMPEWIDNFAAAGIRSFR
jgi:hypothetical protein